MKSTKTFPQKVQPYAISVDWLQVYCHVDNPNIEDFIPLFSSQFEIIKMPHGTRQFKNVYEVYTIDKENIRQKNDQNNPIKHNRNYHCYCTSSYKKSLLFVLCSIMQAHIKSINIFYQLSLQHFRHLLHLD